MIKNDNNSMTSLKYTKKDGLLLTSHERTSSRVERMKTVRVRSEVVLCAGGEEEEPGGAVVGGGGGVGISPLTRASSITILQPRFR